MLVTLPESGQPVPRAEVSPAESSQERLYPHQCWEASLWRDCRVALPWLVHSRTEARQCRKVRVHPAHPLLLPGYRG